MFILFGGGGGIRRSHLLPTAEKGLSGESIGLTERMTRREEEDVGDVGWKERKKNRVKWGADGK